MASANNKGDVLIVDDTPENLTVLRHILKEQGYSVRPALTGKIALKAVQTTPPDIVLMDIMMPGLDGFEVCNILKNKEESKHIPVLFISASTEPDNKVKGFQSGGLDYITKPFHAAEVLARVETHISLSRLQKKTIAQNKQLQQEVEERKRAETALEKANSKLKKLASIDCLTNLANRRQFDDQLSKEWVRLTRESKPISLLICDLDFFKKYNDYYGHPAGDKCLKEVASAIRSATRRPADIVARYGGEEFAVIMPNTCVDGAKMVAKEICKTIRKLKIPHFHSEVIDFVSISIGLATMLPCQDTSQEQLIDDADKQLYKAKQEGRDRISYPPQ